MIDQILSVSLQEHKPRRHPEYTGHLEHFRPLENGGFAMSVLQNEKYSYHLIPSLSSYLTSHLFFKQLKFFFISSAPRLLMKTEDLRRRK